MEAETTQKTEITLTPSAVSEVRSIIEKKALGGAALRLSVEGGGCSGLSYKLNFDSEITQHDDTFEFEGLTVIVDKKSAVHLSGTTLDFSTALVGGGFKFQNPNAKQSCGCGESFST